MNLTECLEYFSHRFLFAMEKKDDSRNFSLDDINEPDSEISSDEVFCFWCQDYDEERIQIYYDTEQITQKYLTSEINDENLKLILNYLAMHEYGHTYMSQKADEIRIFTDEENESIDTILYIDYCSIENPFREFFADYIGSNIDNTPPLPFINNNLQWIRQNLLFHKDAMLPMTNFQNGNTKRELRFYYYLKNMERFFIFNSWNLLEQEYNNTSNSEMIRFFKIIFELFERLAETHSIFRNTRKNLIRLVHLLDQYTYDNLIKSNLLEESLESSLEDFVISFD